MIVVKLIGGLGNQLFQYAFGRYLAIKNNTEIKLDISGFKDYKLHKYGLHHFNIIENFPSEKELKLIKKPLSPLNNFIILMNCKITGNTALLYINEAQLDNNRKNFILPDNVYLDGYWQSEKYFIDISDIIRKEFSVKNEPDGLNQENLTIINKTNSVNLHIRRQDYVLNPVTKQIHGVLGMGYYEECLNRVEEKVKNPQIFIFSDDISWARSNLKTDLPLHFIDYNGAEKNYEDLRLMSHCKHHIIANSSFSWWGAWLCNYKDKIVYCPQKWFNTPDPPIDTKDLIPESWIKIE